MVRFATLMYLSAGVWIGAGCASSLGAPGADAGPARPPPSADGGTGVGVNDGGLAPPPPGGETFAPPSGPHFGVLWVEPAEFLAADRQSLPTQEDVHRIVRAHRRRGVHTMVIAYAELLGCFFYNPWESYSFVQRNPDANTTTLVSASSPARRCAILADPTAEVPTLVDAMMAEAAALNPPMKVILGLSRTGDLHLMNDLENARMGRTSSIVVDTPPVAQRLAEAVAISKTIAQDLYAQFGESPAFYGWYLTHESTCLNIGMEYFAPMGNYLKHQLSPGKVVMVSPLVHAHVCPEDGSLGYAQYLADFAEYVDIFAYQDTLGAGTVVHDGITRNHYTSAARQQRLFELTSGGSTSFLARRQAAHQAAGTTMWMNVEGWEMDGECEGGWTDPSNPDKQYGCPYAAAWKRVEQQLLAYHELGLPSMLNEGTLLFDFGPGSRATRDPYKQVRAAAFTAGYDAFLGLDPQVGVRTQP